MPEEKQQNNNNVLTKEKSIDKTVTSLPKEKAEKKVPVKAKSAEVKTKSTSKISESERKFIFKSSPHFKSEETVSGIMYRVILSLVPACLVGIYIFGLSAFKVMFLAVAASMLFEAGFQYINKIKITVTDGSAALTGLLLAMNMPSNAPWWLVIIGSFIAIIISKQFFGGLGNNPFNPALVARVFLLISWPVQMTSWPKLSPLFGFSNPCSNGVDACTSATPLGMWKEEIMMGRAADAASIVKIQIMDPFIGFVGGSLGEISVIALILGAAYLFYKGYISWHIPITFIGTVFIATGLFWLISPETYLNPFIHVFTGGLILGAFFMATDMVTTPVTKNGMIIFGFGCGVFTVLIRLFGGYPEGVSFAILIMNAVTPLIDKYIKPKTFGA